MGTADKVCCTFTTYNVLGTIFGLLVVAVASWLAADKISFFTELKLLEREENGEVNEQFSNISVVDHGAFILIAIGVAIVIQSVLGCTGTMMGCCRNELQRNEDFWGALFKEFIIGQEPVSIVDYTRPSRSSIK